MNDNTITFNLKDSIIGVIGLGYVGLPLAIEFASHFPVIGFDINKNRVNELMQRIDKTKEAEIEKLDSVIVKEPNLNPGLFCTTSIEVLQMANIFIVTVPTPIDKYNSPDLKPLLSASEMLGKILKKGDVVIYESTVYPGCTEEECVPVLEKFSNLRFNLDFFVGYSPERINPGDKIHTLTSVVKVTSGSNENTAIMVNELYSLIIKAGTHLAPSIKVAEASKAIENAQRDVNISFVNELAIIFDRVGIDTTDVLEAAGTKYNFLKYKPGLVGGHCISVDPYYLAHKSSQLGYHPQVILSGRRVNDLMGEFIASKLVKLMIHKGHTIKNSDCLILGVTFKENCPDIRNTKVIDIYHQLSQFGLNVDIYDPWASIEEVKEEFGIDLIAKIDKKYSGIILAVSHEEFGEIDFSKIGFESSIIFDAKSFLNRDMVDARL